MVHGEYADIWYAPEDESSAGFQACGRDLVLAAEGVAVFSIPELAEIFKDD